MEDAEQNKLFVGGISWETTENILKEYFCEYGTVLSCIVAADRNTGKPRGFAFVTFAESSAIDRALQDSHRIHGRTVEVKRAIPRSEQQSQQQHQRGLTMNMNNAWTNHISNNRFGTKKIFVGGLSANLTEEEFRNYFGKFGRITDVVVMHDNVTHRPRGFGFITFDSEDSVEQVMRKNFHELTGKLVEVKRAVPKDGRTINSSNNGYNERGLNSNSYPQESFVPSVGYYPTAPYGNVVNYSYGTGIYGGGYPSAGYGYGPTMIAQRGPWPPAMVGYRGGFFPYGGVAPMYATYFNGAHGPMGLGGNGYSGGILSSGFSVKMAAESSQYGGGADM